MKTGIFTNYDEICKINYCVRNGIKCDCYDCQNTECKDNECSTCVCGDEYWAKGSCKGKKRLEEDREQQICKETAKEILDEVSKHYGGRWLMELYQKYGVE